MQLPDDILETGVALKDQYFDIKGLSKYCSLGASSLRHHIRENKLPHYPVRNKEGKGTKILVKRSEFDEWMKQRWRLDIERIADEVIEALKSD